jgi:DNA-binding NarL/FixJ family response regulator
MNNSESRVPSNRLIRYNLAVRPKYQDQEQYVEAAAPVCILLVDDFEPFRTYVASALGAIPGARVVAEAKDGLEAVQSAQALQPDLIVLDVGLPKLNGIEAARQIRKVSPTSTILFLSENMSPEIAREALDTGALGYVVKSDAAGELLLAVNEVLLGKRFISARLENQGL